MPFVLFASRRQFCRLGGAATLLVGLRAEPALALTSASASAADGLELAAIERPRVLAAAEHYLRIAPVTITAFPAPRAKDGEGGRHDYFSEGDYWWPNPRDPNGPYVRRDGQSNPANFTAHRRALIAFSVQAASLAAAWRLTGEARFARHAARHLRAWFVDPATRMNPNLRYAQAIHGISTGRSIGIIDTIHLVEVARSAQLLSEGHALPASEDRAVRAWFTDYTTWLTTSRHGIAEREAKNNHGTCWVVQVAAFAAYLARGDWLKYCGQRFQTVLVPNQMAPNGSFPLELRRTKPYGYSLFNLDMMAAACQILSMNGVGVAAAPAPAGLWPLQLPDGRGMRRAMEFMVPYVENKRSWPYPPDVMYFDDWPVRQPSLLFAGLAYGQSRYLALWRRLNPDPTVEEVLRNFPIRQPLLWISPQRRLAS